MANVTPWATIQGSLPPLIAPPKEDKPPATVVFAPIHAPTTHEAPDMSSLQAVPQPQLRPAVFAPIAGSLPDIQQHLENRMAQDYAKDLTPYGSPTNHPGVFGKVLHELSVLTGGPGRRQMDEADIQNRLEHLTPIEGEEELRQAQEQAARERGTAAEEEAQAKLNPPEKPAPEPKPEKWTTLKSPTGDVLKGPDNKIIQQNEAGDLRAVDLPEGATIAPKETPDHSAYAEWSKNPQSFEAFQKFMHSFTPKGSRGAGFSPYAAILAMRYASQENPGIMPIAAQMTAQAFKGAGINLTPEEVSKMSGVPEGQPISPETGNPIGTAMPEAPTQAIRTSAQGAQTLENMINQNILPALDEASRSGEVGPMSGRVQDFLLRKVGNPDSPAAKLQATLDAVGPMLGRMYGFHSAQYAHNFSAFLNTRMTPDALKGYLQGVTEHAKTAEAAQRGYGETVHTEAPTGKSLGHTTKADGIWTMNGKQYRVKNGEVYAY